MGRDKNLRTLYLLRHAKSSWRDSELSDFDRPLNKRGLRARVDIASYMDQMNYRPDVIICSTAKRAVMTLDAVRPLVPDSKIVMDEGMYLADPQALAHRIEQVENDNRSILLLGHNPGLHMLALALSVPVSGPQFTALQAKYPTAALCVLQTHQQSWKPVTPNSYQLADFVLPRELAAA